MKELALATAFALVVTSGVALAQQYQGPIGGGAPTVTTPPASYKGPGGMMSYKGSEYTSNVDASASSRMPPKTYKGPGGMMGYNGSDYVSNVQPSAGTRRPPKTYKGPGGMMSYNGTDYSRSTQRRGLYNQAGR